MRKYLPLLLTVALFVPGLTARSADADTPEEQLAAASALFDAQKYAEAAQKLDAFLVTYPKHAKVGTAAFVLGRARAELKQFDKAVPAYEKAVAAKDPNLLTMAELGLGEAAINARQFDKAAAALAAALKDKDNLKPTQAIMASFWLGQADFNLKRFAEAQAAYESVVENQAAARRAEILDGALYGAGVSALRQNKMDDARQRLRLVVDRFPNSEDRPDAMLILAQMDLNGKRLDPARAGFEGVLNLGNKAPKETRQAAEDGLIQTLLAQEDYSAVVPRLEAALSRLPAGDPQRYRAQLNLGNARYRQKQYDPALAAYLEAAKSTEEAVAAQGMYWAGNAALSLKRPADAATQFNALVTKYPKNDLAAKAQLKAGDAYVDAKQNDLATRAYQNVVKQYATTPQADEARKALAEMVNDITDPVQLAAALKNAPPAERAQGQLRLARLYLQKKQYVEAVKPLSDLLMTMPAAPLGAEANYLLGVAYEAQDKYVPAEVALAEAVRKSADADWLGDAQGRLAWVYLTLKQPAKSEAAANAALGRKLEPNVEQQTRLALVQAQLDQQKWDAALEGSKTLLNGNPTPETVAAVLFTQAWVSEKRGKPDEAAPVWEKLAADYPKSEYAAQALLKLGDARLKEEKYDEAKEKYATLLTNFPRSPLAPEARYKLGSALYSGGHPAEAAVEFDTVAADKTAGDYGPESLYWAGVALDKAGKKADAIQRLTKLVSQYPTHTRVANAKIRLAALKAVGG